MYETWEDFFQGIEDVTDALDNDRYALEGIPTYPPPELTFKGL